MKKYDFKHSELIIDILSQLKTESSNDPFSTLKDHKNGVLEETYIISSDDEVKFYRKNKGTYKLLSIPDILLIDNFKHIQKVVNSMFKDIIGEITREDKVLVVGLGNRHISSDSLGTKVVSQININILNKDKPKVMAFCPSVMGLTGIATYDTLKGVVSRIKPTHLILIDSLCASNIDRLGKSIQISNTGMCPGSGIGNNQKCIDKSFAKNVYSIGVPLLIYASTFIGNAFAVEGITMSKINNTMQKLKKSTKNQEFIVMLNGIKKVYLNNLDDVIVSIKDIEECVNILSTIIANGINFCTSKD